jgi:hypothetical protein
VISFTLQPLLIYLFIYLRANLAVQRRVTKWAAMSKKNEAKQAQPKYKNKAMYTTIIIIIIIP